MKYYGIVEIDITDAGWVRDYVAGVTPMIEARGARYLTRTTNVEKLEGERPAAQVVLIIEWPSKEVADEFYESEDYRPYREARIAGAKTELVMLPAEDVTGTARID